MRIIFMGTPDFSVPVLEGLITAGHDVAAVYCQPPKRAGRGKKERTSPVHAKALAMDLLVRHPKSLRDTEIQAEFAALEADVAVVVAYGLILPQEILDAPRHGCLNIHASLLPRWRGAAPIHRAIMAGDSETGVCIMQMEAGLDTGPVVLRKTTAIGDLETTGDLHDRLSQMGAAAIIEALDRLDTLSPEPQSKSGVTYAEKIDKAEAHIDWAKPAERLVRQINGLSPFPGAWTDAQGERIKMLQARYSSLPLRPGETRRIDRHLMIGASGGSVEILRAQRAGKKPADIAELLKGWSPPSQL